jgi:hypothetical protein
MMANNEDRLTTVDEMSMSSSMHMMTPNPRMTTACDTDW